jgi:divalent metal cation (Fe/Co/Zn/Cd) transporter
MADRSKRQSPGCEAIVFKQKRAVELCLLLVVLTFLPVLAATLLSGSVLLLSEVFDYIRVFITSLVGWAALRAICRGRTHAYDYGAGKLETLGAVGGSMVYIIGLLAAAGFSMHRLLHPVELRMGGTMFAASYQFIAFSIDCWLWMRNRRLALESYSPVMEMQWRVNRADAVTGLAVFLSLLLTLVLRSFAWSIYIDPVSALLFIAYAAVTLYPGLASGISELLDKTLQEDLQLRIDRWLIRNFEGYDDFYGVRSRRSGARIYIEIGLGFRPEKTVAEALETINDIKRGIEAEIPGSEVRVALLPMSPVNPACGEDLSPADGGKGLGA